MSKKAFDSIMAGLQDALAYTKGDKTRGRTTVFNVRDLDVGKARGKGRRTAESGAAKPWPR